MAVTTEINLSACEYKTTTGKDAKNIYLGRNQMRELLGWAESNGYTFAEGLRCDPCREEEARLEYGGRKIFEVNAADHLAVA